MNELRIVDGAPIWYHPSMRSEPRFAGVLDGNVVRICGETPCIRLREMEEAYGVFKAGGRDVTKLLHRYVVVAAALTNIEPRET